MWTFLESGEGATRQAAAEGLGLLAGCFTPELAAAAVKEAPAVAGGAEPSSAVGRIVVQATKALDSLALAGAMSELLAVIGSLVEHLRFQLEGGKTAAEALVLPVVEKIAALRVQKAFEYKEAADGVLSVAMRVLGPEVLLARLPLNLEPSDRSVHPSMFSTTHADATTDKPAKNLAPSSSRSSRSRIPHLWPTLCTTSSRSVSACSSTRAQSRWRTVPQRRRCGACLLRKYGRAWSGTVMRRRIYPK